MMKAVGLGPMPHGRSGRRAGAVAALGALIVVFALVCVAGQCAMVVVSGDVVQANPEFAPSRWVYTVAGILGVACVEAAMVPLWNLLTLVDRLDVFSGRAVRWVDAIIACAAVEAALVLFVTLYGGLAHAEYRDPASGAYVDVALGAPGVVLLGAVGLLLLAAFVLLMLVMRSLLAAAIAQHDELEAVI
ncbi:DUF2975 domain-containing protein [uncultured Bifidobacterium sp.]|uniref:DUF2975 domain-containing protein n=1 Tax=uncultured Bifidobacterium sp. TaxID=165187 RepID=UPI00258FAA49|nr:DUF2975 domain-containing protein [uncultured Bifidobacterium sp.]